MFMYYLKTVNSLNLKNIHIFSRAKKNNLAAKTPLIESFIFSV